MTALRQHRHWRRRWISYSIIWRRKTFRTQSRKRPEAKEPATQLGGAPAWLRSTQVTRGLDPFVVMCMSTPSVYNHLHNSSVCAVDVCYDILHLRKDPYMEFEEFREFMLSDYFRSVAVFLLQPLMSLWVTFDCINLNLN